MVAPGSNPASYELRHDIRRSLPARKWVERHYVYNLAVRCSRRVCSLYSLSSECTRNRPIWVYHRMLCWCKILMCNFCRFTVVSCLHSSYAVHSDILIKPFYGRCWQRHTHHITECSRLDQRLWLQLKLFLMWIPKGYDQLDLPHFTFWHILFNKYIEKLIEGRHHHQHHQSHHCPQLLHSHLQQHPAHPQQLHSPSIPDWRQIMTWRRCQIQASNSGEA